MINWITYLFLFLPFFIFVKFLDWTFGVHPENRIPPHNEAWENWKQN